MNLSLHELADKELRETAEYYELQNEGLGDVFLNEVERVLSRFPYTIFYSIKESTISVLAISNQKRRPWYWRNR